MVELLLTTLLFPKLEATVNPLLRDTQVSLLRVVTVLLVVIQGVPHSQVVPHNQVEPQGTQVRPQHLVGMGDTDRVSLLLPGVLVTSQDQQGHMGNTQARAMLGIFEAQIIEPQYNYITALQLLEDRPGNSDKSGTHRHIFLVKKIENENKGLGHQQI